MNQLEVNTSSVLLISGVSILVYYSYISIKTYLAAEWSVPLGSRVFALFLVFRFLGGGDLFGTVQERAQCHSAKHVPVSLLYELDQLADVAVQTLSGQRVTKQSE